jgi:hypothetical protein
MLDTLPFPVVCQHIIPHLDPGEVVALVSTTRCIRHEFLRAYPTYYADSFPRAHAIRGCFARLVGIVRDMAPRSAEFHFTHDWNCRHGFTLNRGACMSICKVHNTTTAKVIPKYGELFVINGTRRKHMREQSVGEVFKELVVRNWPHVEMRTCLRCRSPERRRHALDVSRQLIRALDEYVRKKP